MKRPWLFLLLLPLTACGHVLPQTALDRVDRGLDFQTVRSDPENYRGHTMLLGGVIQGYTEEGDETTLRIYRWKLDRWGEPVDADDSGGSFLVITDSPLDPERFAAGRLLTLTASVVGSRAVAGNHTVERLPVFRLQERYLWETPYRYMVRRDYNIYAPSYIIPGDKPRDNPFDPGWAPYPYTPLDLQPGSN